MYCEDWGEALTNKSVPVICVMSLQSGSVSVLQGVPPDVSPGQVRTEQRSATSSDTAGLKYFHTVSVCTYKCQCRFIDLTD